MSHSTTNEELQASLEAIASIQKAVRRAWMWWTITSVGMLIASVIPWVV